WATSPRAAVAIVRVSFRGIFYESFLTRESSPETLANCRDRHIPLHRKLHLAVSALDIRGSKTDSQIRHHPLFLPLNGCGACRIFAPIRHRRLDFGHRTAFRRAGPHAHDRVLQTADRGKEPRDAFFDLLLTGNRADEEDLAVAPARVPAHPGLTR